MKIFISTLVVFLVSACGAFDNAHYMPGESQIRSQNPQLLKCPVGLVISCKTSGGRTGKTYSNCACAKARF
ncbi:MAG: hypothetical protein R3192_07540 [Woeseiaceae bacterium]|nr:hypothetical protein [Woeseiaceae bacterium]